MKALLLALVAAMSSAALAALAEPPVRPATPPPVRVYQRACASCHANNGFGVQTLTQRRGKPQAVLLDRTDLTEAYVRLAVRRGVGAMPPMSKVEVSDEELSTIIATLTDPKRR